jgi:hypothetical protein
LPLNHCTLPGKVTDPCPADPFHWIVMRQVPAILNSLVAEYRPGTSVRATSIVPNIGVPDIDMLALARTVPTSIGSPDADLNSMTNVSAP